MSRHRNVRSMDFAEEYEGYDDVYGHSVEDDFCVSPSMAQYIYDRNSGQHQPMASFFGAEGGIAEENEDLVDDAAPDAAGAEGAASRIRHDSTTFRTPPLSHLDEARLQSCLDEMHNVVGDSVPEPVLVKTILKHQFNLEKALNEVLVGSHGENAVSVPSETAEPLPQRDKRERGKKKPLPDALEAVKPEKLVVADSVEAPLPLPADDALDPLLKVVPVKSHTTTVVRGFDVPLVDSPVSDTKLDNSRLPSQLQNEGSKEEEEGESVEKKILKDAAVKSSSVSRSKESQQDAQSRYQKERNDAKELLNLVVIGHVDAGKSTLMGHLLYQLGEVNKKTMHKYEQESKKLGKQSFVFAWVLDETGEERSRGITMDVGHSKFETPSKVVTLLDAPGHKDFIPNMITGAAQADVATLVVDATRGEFETGFESGGQTREHALLVRSLGVSQLAVAVNKLDTVNWSQERFEEIQKKLGVFLKQAGFRDGSVTFIPCSGLSGENLTQPPSEPLLKSWYKGPTLIEVIDGFQAPERPVSKPFRMTISDLFRNVGSGFCVAGKVETGLVNVGDKTLVQPQGEVAQVKGIQVDDFPIQTAFAGDHVAITLSGVEMQNVAVGYVLCDPAQPIRVATRIQARVVVFNIDVPITRGFSVILHFQSLAEQATVKKLVSTLHKNTGQVLKQKPRCLTKNSNAVIELEVGRPVCMELYREVKELGRFMLRSGGATIAAGMVTEIY